MSSASGTKSITSFFSPAAENEKTQTQTLEEPLDTSDKENVKFCEDLVKVEAKKVARKSFFGAVTAKHQDGREKSEDAAEGVKIEREDRKPFFSRLMAQQSEEKKEEDVNEDQSHLNNENNVSRSGDLMKGHFFTAVKSKGEARSETVEEDDEGNDSVSVEELIPSLENYDPSLLALLPLALR